MFQRGVFVRIRQHGFMNPFEATSRAINEAEKSLEEEGINEARF
jgi:hypothetical protein